MTDDQPTKKGVFITFEGGEGVGKSTHIKFLAASLRKQGEEVVCLREPGGTDIGEQLRAVVLDAKNKAMSNEAELLVYEAARAQIVAEVIAPALERGAVVLCDRFFDSTVAYQACGRGLSREFVDRANDFACQGIHPDRTVLLVLSGSSRKGLHRATRRNGADRLESAGVDFHDRVNAAFLDIAAAEPDRVRVVESAEKRSQTAKRVFSQLEDLFPWMADGEACDEEFFAGLDRPPRRRSPRKVSRSGSQRQRSARRAGYPKGSGSARKRSDGSSASGSRRAEGGCR